MTPGQVAYEAYVRAVGGRSVAGDVLPGWGDQEPRIVEAWEVAADAVVRSLGAGPTERAINAMMTTEGNPGGGDPVHRYPGAGPGGEAIYPDSPCRHPRCILEHPHSGPAILPQPETVVIPPNTPQPGV